MQIPNFSELEELQLQFCCRNQLQMLIDEIEVWCEFSEALFRVDKDKTEILTPWPIPKTKILWLKIENLNLPCDNKKYKDKNNTVSKCHQSNNSLELRNSYTSVTKMIFFHFILVER